MRRSYPIVAVTRTLPLVHSSLKEGHVMSPSEPQPPASDAGDDASAQPPGADASAPPVAPAPPPPSPTPPPLQGAPTASYAMPPPPPQQQQYAAPPGVYQQQSYYAGSAPKSKMVAGLLGIFLGGFGVHRFYLGYTTIGILQIVVTIVTCGLGGIWGFVEGIMILMGQPQFRTDAKGVPLTE